MVPEVAGNPIVPQSLLLRGEPLAKRPWIGAGASPIPDRALPQAAIDIANEPILRFQVLSEVREQKDEPASLVMIPLAGATAAPLMGSKNSNAGSALRRWRARGSSPR